MAELIEIGKAWFLGLGIKYGVNPIVFGSIYIGAIPFFTASLAWLVRNYRREKPILLPSFCVVFFFVSSYLYLVIEGENIPWWIYCVVVVMVAYGGWTTWRKICRKLNLTNQEDITADDKI